ncbi:MAG: helix-turn-helix domain-containing protein [Flavobacteriaceae bacterium]|nr:AraC family transcriptional regulator [Flavobacteriaceae bacterium]
MALLFPDNYLLARAASYGTIPADAFQEHTKFSDDSLQLFKERAIIAAKNNDLPTTAFYVEEYVKYSAETGFVESRYFLKFKDTNEFQALRAKYDLNVTWLHFFYLFSALIGFFIGFMLLTQKTKDKKATLLISLFVLIHSLFIFHIFLHSTNLKFRMPHILYMSSISSYLYGPLLYFYFKRITQKYSFKRIDLLHLLPTAIIIVIMFPLFLLSKEEKLRIMFEVGSFNRMPYLVGIVTTKILSLIIYGGLLLNLYFKNNLYKEYTPETRKWLTTLVILSSIYVISYAVYGLVLAEFISSFSFLLELQIVMMAIMVVYIGYASFRSPNLFIGNFNSKNEKYLKSGLTPSYSLELKDTLLHLFEKDKVYLQNDVSLDQVSLLLGTTRHNTSQVINEHFGLNFFELINKYRIADAAEMLKKEQKLNIIDVAYEVGFNNKVTFNKSFKKFLKQTPSQYLASL